MDLVQTQLSEAQLRATTRLIAMGMGYKEVAGELSIDRTTLYRWRKMSVFADEVSRLMESARDNPPTSGQGHFGDQRNRSFYFVGCCSE